MVWSTNMTMPVVALMGLTLAAGLFVTAADHRPGTARSAVGERDVCTARELSRSRLVVDGERELYVEPKVLEASGTQVLLAGKPSYLFAKRRPGATAEVESRHAVFGAVIDPGGSARIVPAPPVNAGKVAAVAGTAAHSGAWRVIFAELDSVALGGEQQVAAFWHGVYDGQLWSSLERLPLPQEPVLYYNAANLVQNGDTVVWAALTQLDGNRQGVVTFERRGGVWSHQLLTTPFASAVEAIHTPAAGFVLAIEHSDTLAGGRHSTFLYTRASGWKEGRKLPALDTEGLPARSGEPDADTGRSDPNSLTLRLSPRASALASREEPFASVVRLLGTGFAAFTMGGGNTLWVTHHFGADEQAEQDELRLVRALRDSLAVLWRTPQPYTGGFSATRYSPTDVLIVGPELDRAHELLVSLNLRLRVECVSPVDRPD